MAVRYIRHLGYINPDHISMVRFSPAQVSYGGVARYKDGPKKGRPRAHRPWVWWGKPQRPLGGLYIDGFRRKPAEVHVWWVNDNWSSIIKCHHDLEAKRWEAEIRADLAEPIGMERIVAAAVRRLEHHKGDIVSSATSPRMWVIHSIEAPARHHDILHRMRGQALDVEQGFLTSTGRFVDRKEAWLIALAACQLTPTDAAKRAPVTPDLFSEDLW